ncbi:MAG: type II toxin-antitoxin system VapC family toxin [Chloroflexi bacterium]|nr:type II toxin-antitoxin system VapC family toxin [Chloroflexota bacterium]
MIALDTDILIDILRNYAPAIQWLLQLGPGEIAIPGFVAMELVQGCRDSVEQVKVEQFLNRFIVVWPSAQTCDAALTVFIERRLSHNLGLLDALVGQTARELSLPLHTFNQKHYRAIPDLQTVQPYMR